MEFQTHTEGESFIWLTWQGTEVEGELRRKPGSDRNNETSPCSWHFFQSGSQTNTPHLSPLPPPSSPTSVNIHLLREWVPVGQEAPESVFLGQAEAACLVAWALQSAPLGSGVFLQVFARGEIMKNQHQSGPSPWKLKLSHRQIRAGARLFWASNHCVQRRMHHSCSPARQQPRKHQLLRAASSLLRLLQHKTELCLAGSVWTRVRSSFKLMK